MVYDEICVHVKCRVNTLKTFGSFVSSWCRLKRCQIDVISKQSDMMRGSVALRSFDAFDALVSWSKRSVCMACRYHAKYFRDTALHYGSVFEPSWSADVQLLLSSQAAPSHRD